MVQEQWSGIVSAKAPSRFDSAAGVLELRACCLASAGTESSTLFCQLPGRQPLALSRLAARVPHCVIRARFKEEVTFTCDGSDMLVIGIVKPHSQTDACDPDAPPAKKRKQTHAVESTVAKPTAEMSSDASQAAVTSEPLMVQLPAHAATSSTTVPPKASDFTTAASKSNAARTLKSNSKAPLATSATVAETQVAPQPAVTSSSGSKTVACASSEKNKQTKPEVQMASPLAKGSLPAKTDKRTKDPNPIPAVARKVLSSGLEYEVIRAGNGPQAMLGTTVQVRYEGRLAKTGQRFDKGIIKFRLGVGEVIRGWDEGVKGMLKGEKRRLLVPPRLGYGSRGAPPAIPPNASLVFEVEFVG